VRLWQLRVLLQPNSPAYRIIAPDLQGVCVRRLIVLAFHRNALQVLVVLNSLRIGCVKYVNARPLIRGWPGNVEFDHPSALCQRLANGDLDVALVSSFEYLRNPIYRIVDDVSISSDGPVSSVVIAYRGDVSEIEEIELDPASQTSVNLLRCILKELGLKPRLIGNIGFQPVCPAGLQPADSAAVQPTESKTAENIPTACTGTMPMFRPADSPAFHAFDKHADIHQTRRNLPHWEQEGATYFVTFRLADAVPAELARQWRGELETWRKFHPEPWDSAVAAEYRRRFLQPREDWLDQGHGSCLLRNSKAAEVVAQALRFFDEQRYYLDAFVVMPNHVHVLVQPLTGFGLSDIIRSWKSYTARQLNKLFGRSGAVWMQESFDRIIRDSDALVRCRVYIAKNPEKPRLRRGEFILSTAEKLRNTGFQPVRPAGLHRANSATVPPAESETAENISAGRTGKMPMFQVPHCAQLLIGDQAIQFRQKHAGEFQFWDLGEQWKKLTGLPFVYALWLIRPEVRGAKSVARRLRNLRDKNLASLDDIIAEAVAGVDDPGSPNMTREFLVHYFRDHLRFSFGEKEKQGLQCFADLCVKHGVLPARQRSFTVV
jgi:predicted solute-binding protein/REP element-mobilizing transposase RayT